MKKFLFLLLALSLDGQIVLYGQQCFRVQPYPCLDLGGLMILPSAQDLTVKDGAVDRPCRGAGSGYHSRIVKETEKASPGYYSVDLYDAYMKAGMTASTRCDFFRFTAQRDFDYRILMDMAFPSEYNFKLDSTIISRVSDKQIEGFAKCNVDSWNQYTGYFVIRFNRPFSFPL